MTGKGESFSSRSVNQSLEYFHILGDTALVRLLTHQITQLSITSYVNKDKPVDKDQLEIFPRMSNLEELTLFLTVSRCNSTYINGNQLHDNVLSSMTRLEKFSFCIQTRLFNSVIEMELPSEDNLRNSFFELGYKDVDAFGDVTYVDHRANAHIYSLPYPFKRFDCMTSAFQGGKFDQVRELIMFDRRPFEHRLFQIIARDFPVLQMLLVNNHKEQQVKDHSDKHITFSHLCEFSLTDSHIDYATEFLSNENMALPRLTGLSIAYETLATITNSFTDSRAPLICSQITRLVIGASFVRPTFVFSSFVNVDNLTKLIKK